MNFLLDQGFIYLDPTEKKAYKHIYRSKSGHNFTDADDLDQLNVNPLLKQKLIDTLSYLKARIAFVSNAHVYLSAETLAALGIVNTGQDGLGRIFYVKANPVNTEQFIIGEVNANYNRYSAGYRLLKQILDVDKESFTVGITKDICDVPIEKFTQALMFMDIQFKTGNVELQERKLYGKSSKHDDGEYWSVDWVLKEDYALKLIK
jgi:hypothetical protein